MIGKGFESIRDVKGPERSSLEKTNNKSLTKKRKEWKRRGRSINVWGNEWINRPVGYVVLGDEGEKGRTMRRAEGSRDISRKARRNA